MGKKGKMLPPTTPDKRQIFCPEQKGFNWPRGIPVIEYRLHGGLGAYRKLMRRRWRRAKNIASLLVGRYWVPVTPLVNPVTGRPSYHIIRLIDDWKPDFCVDLLFSDTNAYLVAFRRQHLSGDGKWCEGKWFHYSDHNIIRDLPPEVKEYCVNLGFDASHTDGSFTSPANIEVMHDIFVVLSSFEDCPRDPKTKKLKDVSDRDLVEAALLKAIVIFAEALRFRSIYMAMLERTSAGDAIKVDGESWNLLHNWHQGSVEVLDLWRTGLPPMHTEAPVWFDKISVMKKGSNDPIKLSTLEHIIGAQGELMLINCDSSKIADMSLIKRMVAHLKTNVCSPIPEPGFHY